MSSVMMGFRLPVQAYDRLMGLAAALGVSRNHTIALLIDSAVVESRSAVSVRLARKIRASDGSDAEGNRGDADDWLEQKEDLEATRF